MEPEVYHIGEVAGKIWRQLSSEGRTSVARLARQLGERQADVHMAVGWLAREDKVQLQIEGRNTHVTLREGAQGW